jgi:hypothetical protein|tara:strand:- start:3854 stop:4891 length:1038 start_codon:yes stop_codon:yes gene_type:complete
MQCPKCGYFQKHKYGFSCGGCRYQFVIDPKTTGFGDKRIKNAIDKLSAGDKYFTQEELYCKCFKPSKFSFGCFAFLVVLVAGGFLFFITNAEGGTRILLVVGLVLSIAGIILAYLFHTPGSDGRVIPAANSYVGRYFPPNLLKTDKIKEGSLSQVNYEEFQPDHFLVVDCKETLAQLLTNGFHRDHNCLIMTDQKYPKKAFQYYRKFKLENPDAKLHLFHDASHEADMMAQDIASDGAWQTSLDAIVDLGIHTSNLHKTKRGTWRKGSELAAHCDKQKYIDDRLRDRWKYLIDSLPQGKLLTLLGFALESGHTLLGEEFHLVYVQDRPGADVALVGGDGGFDDFG